MKALVIGGDSLIGAALVDGLARRGHAAQRTSRRGADGAFSLDLAAPLPASLPECDVAFFCAAITSFAANRERPQLAERVNVLAPVELASRLVERGARVVLLSSSVVLDCQEPHMRAERPYAPRGAYGRFKAAAERGFLALGRQASVLRLTKVLRASDLRIAEWTSALRAGRPIRVFDDHRIAPLCVHHVVDALIAIGGDGAEEGIYQVSGRDDVSYAEIGAELGRRLGVAPSLVQPCPATVAGIPADEVTPYTSLDTGRLRDLCGFVAPDARSVLESVWP